MRKILSLALAIMMILSLAVAANAAEETYKIIITNTSDKHTYEAFNIFTGEVTTVETTVEQGGEEVTVTDYVLSSINWGNGLNVSEAQDAFTEMFTSKGISFTGESASTTENPDRTVVTALEVAEALKNKSITSFDVAQVLNKTGVLKADPQAWKVPEGATEITLEFSHPGYYLIRDKAGSLVDAEGKPVVGEAYSEYMLNVANTKTGVKISAKASVPSLTKKVKENSRTGVSFEDNTLPVDYTKGFNDVADYAKGDLITFELIGTLPSKYAEYSSYHYEFVDTLSAGLVYAGTFTVRAVHADGTVDDISSSFHSSGVQSGNQFSIACENLKAIANVRIDQATKIVVQYTARLNENAVVGSVGNENSAHLVFSNNPNPGHGGELGSTEEDYVVVYTYQLDATKVNAQGNHTPLKDAQFYLYYEVDSNTKHYYKATAKESGKFEVTWVEDETQATVITSDASGKFSFVGLDSGIHYFLHEVAAPQGYNLLPSDLEFVISTNISGSVNDYVHGNTKLTTVTVTPAQDDYMKAPAGATVSGTGWQGNAATGTLQALIFNTNASQLPTTGGMGTTLFYVLGAALTVVAVVLLVTKKRMVAEN